MPLTGFLTLKSVGSGERFGKARQGVREYLRSINPAHDDKCSQNINEYIEANRPDIVRMQKFLKDCTCEARKVYISREMHLAHCYLKGRTYGECEKTCRIPPRSNRIVLELLECLPKDLKPEVLREQKIVLEECIKMWLDNPVMTRVKIEEEGIKKYELKIANQAYLEALNKETSRGFALERVNKALVEAQCVVAEAEKEQVKSKAETEYALNRYRKLLGEVTEVRKKNASPATTTA